MKLLPVYWFLCIGIYSGFTQVKNQDSIQILQEVIVEENSLKPLNLGITPYQELGEIAIESRSPLDIAGTMNQISGVYFMSGALNTNRITIRGVGARTLYGTNKLRMYYNEIPITNGTGISTLEAFDLENLKTIGVVKGPKGVAYGSRLGGTVLLNSDTPGSEGGILENRVTFGSYSLFKNNLGFSYKDDIWTTELRMNYLQTEGYRENNSFDRKGILLNLGVQTSAENTLSLLVNYLDYLAQIPSSISRTAFEENPQQAAFTWAASQGYEDNRSLLVGISDQWQITDNMGFTGSLFYTTLDHYEPRPFNILDEFTKGYGFRSVIKGQSKTSSISWSAGAELYKDEYVWSTFENLYEETEGAGSLQGEQISENKEFRTQIHNFVSLGIRLTPKFQGEIGLSANKTNYDYQDLFNSGTANRSARRAFNWFFSPSLNLNYEWSDNVQFYANLSRGFNNPGLEETLNPDGIVNPEIQQESGWNYEGGAKLSSADERFNGSLAFYRMDIRNLLVSDRVGEDQYIGRNAGRTEHHGIELNAQYNVLPNNESRLIPFVSYTLNAHRFKTFMDADGDYSGNALTGVPKHRILSGIRLTDASGWHLNLTYQFVDKIPLTDANSIYSDSYQLVEMQAGFRGAIGTKINWGLQFGVNNLFNTRYASSVLINAVAFGSEPRYYYPGNDRNLYTRLRILYAL